MAALALLCSLLALFGVVNAVTVYNQIGQTVIATGPETSATTTVSAITSSSTLAAYDTLVLNPPALPDPLPANAFTINLQQSATNVNGLSIPVSGAFYGFSVEMSVVTQAIGLNGSYIHPEFLNLMSHVANRAGRVHVRVGGNSQEEARLVQTLDDGKAIEKQKVDTNNPTQTPALLYTPEILYLLSNISALVNVKWYLGVPLNDSTDIRLEIAEYGQRILGDNLLGLQVGNEPDLYARHSHRPETYGPFDYFGEFGDVLNAMKQQNLNTNGMLIGPSLATGDWTPENVWDTGFADVYHDNLYALSVEHYPDDNCAALYEGFGDPKDPQTEFATFLSHSLAVNMVAQYLNSTQIAIQKGKPFIMFETNTASCGGFPGISTSFGAALWVLDYGLTMAASNFSHALLHVGGQNVYYNPFTAIPTNESAFHDWTVGPIFYSVLAVAEALGSTNNSRVIDLWPNSGSLYTPGYAIYENDALARIALINFMSDSTGANDYTATIQIGGGDSGQPAATPSSVKVKRLTAATIGQKYNITWGNQTFGEMKSSDGRLNGDVVIETVQCDTAANTCQIKVPAPGFALVFLSDEALENSEPTTTATFATTAVTKVKNTATIDQAVLATSNGNRGMGAKSGSTSFGSGNAGARGAVGPAVSALLAVVVGAVVAMRAFAQ